ncbi:MAG: C4-type zinc ribbon domain-containing protein [Microscillaceae bacterium]|nr:C4-type zinc ribbon domain-containing protein [Microscillaceae bacterium]
MERTIEQKLSALLKLQKIDSKLDEIKKVRGDLPDEVQDLEDEIVGYQTRIDKFQSETKVLQQEIEAKKQRKKDAEKMIAKYKDQQMNVRNNREYEALTKEIESEELEMQLSDKKIREAMEKISRINEDIEKTKEVLDERKKDLDNKKDELNNIIVESEGEEGKLMKEREKQSKNIEDRLLRSYNKIRTNAINGLAVVSVKRNACGGCFNIVPPQRQAEIREKKKLIVCEHCGRIMADVEDVIEEDPNKLKKPRKTLK